MQVGAVLVFEAGPLALRSGGIDVERVRAYTAERLAGSALVTGDAHFDAEYAVRHVALPRPGDERQLKRLTARVLSQALDPERAPFELWLVEGLDEARFALIAKADAERCRGAELVDALLAPETRRKTAKAPSTPGLGLLRRGVNSLERALVSDARSPLAGASGPHRRVDWLELAPARRERILAALAGGLRAFLTRRGLAPDALAPRAHLWPLDEVVTLATGCAGTGKEAPAEDADPLLALARAAGATARSRPSDLAVADLGRIPDGHALLGARLRACIPLPALPRGHTLGVAVTRCAGRAFVGFCGDAAAARDLALLADAVAAAFEPTRRPAGAPIQVDSRIADGQPLRSYEAQA